MAMFFFCFEVAPTAAAHRSDGVMAGQANVFIKAENVALANVNARSHLMSYGWISSEKAIAAFSPTPEQIAQLDAGLRALHAKAEKAAPVPVAFEIVAWKQSADDDSPIEVRSLGTPAVAPTKKH
jgi:hypothetical protein